MLAEYSHMEQEYTDWPVSSKYIWSPTTRTNIIQLINMIRSCALYVCELGGHFSCDKAWNRHRSCNQGSQHGLLLYAQKCWFSLSTPVNRTDIATFLHGSSAFWIEWSHLNLLRGFIKICRGIIMWTYLFVSPSNMGWQGFSSRTNSFAVGTDKTWTL